MKNIIILQNSHVFSVDIKKLYNPENYLMFLIINKKCFDQLCARGQENFFEKIIVTEEFECFSLVKIIDEIKNFNSYPIDVVTNSELCVNVCGKLRKHYSLSGLDDKIAEKFTNKVSMKNALKDYGVRIPRFVLFDGMGYKEHKKNYINSVIDYLGLPVFIKPIDDVGSNNAKKINSSIELEAWIDNKLQSNSNQLFEFDEFIDGKLFHCDSFIKEGKILYTQISEYTWPVSEFFSGKPLGSITLPSKSTDAIRLELFNKKIINALHYQGSGMTHLEVFKTADDELVFLEIAARAGGAYLSKLYKRYLNIDLYETHFLLQINPNISIDFNNKGAYSAHIWFPSKSGVVESINSFSLKSNFELILHAKVGQCIEKSKILHEKSAEVVLWNDNFETLYDDFCYLKKLHLINIV